MEIRRSYHRLISTMGFPILVKHLYIESGPRYHSSFHCSFPWWRHQMETISTLLALCVGNSQVTGEFPSQGPVTWSFDVFFDLHQNKWLSKQSCRRWFEMPSCSLWCHCKAWLHIWLEGTFYQDTATHSNHQSQIIHIQCGGVITPSIFSQIFTKETP